MKNAMNFNFVIILFVAIFFVSNDYIFSQSKTTSTGTGVPIGIVDIDAIVKEIPEAITADKELVDLSNLYKDSLNAKRDAFESKYQNYEKQKNMMPQAKQTEELEKLQKEAMEVQNYQKDKENELIKRRDVLLEPIRKKVKEVIEAVAKDEKLSLVLTKDATSVVMYFDPKIDITFRVIDKMKRGN